MRSKNEDLWEEEFYDVLKVLEMGAQKYEAKAWLEEEGATMGKARNSDSMFHHLAEHYAGIEQDHESGLSPLLHLACRALMAYTRQQRGIVHPNDIEGDSQ